MSDNNDIFFQNHTYDDFEILQNRKTLRGFTVKNGNKFVYIKRNKDEKIVFAGRYDILKKRYPLLSL